MEATRARPGQVGLSPLGPPGRMRVAPVRRNLVSARGAQNGRVVESAADKLKTDRQSRPQHEAELAAVSLPSGAEVCQVIRGGLRERDDVADRHDLQQGDAEVDVNDLGAQL